MAVAAAASGDENSAEWHLGVGVETGRRGSLQQRSSSRAADALIFRQLQLIAELLRGQCRQLSLLGAAMKAAVSVVSPARSVESFHICRWS